MKFIKFFLPIKLLLQLDFKRLWTIHEYNSLDSRFCYVFFFFLLIISFTMNKLLNLSIWTDDIYHWLNVDVLVSLCASHLFNVCVCVFRVLRLHTKNISFEKQKTKSFSWNFSNLHIKFTLYGWFLVCWLFVFCLTLCLTHLPMNISTHCDWCIYWLDIWFF